ncbi:hypothetical protein [Paenibacillus periandrae]|uniref:hypothetical protein n=1 Tax=Paenibacillus periandrae TaxID=1761741 RepID=UPI001F0906C4|nr:hypothetical protein [Paenibacillus periandrae]
MMKPEREAIYDWSNKNEARNVKVKGLPFPRNKENLLEHAVRINSLTKWDQSKCKSLMKLRDLHSHPEVLTINWISHVRAVIEQACLYINLIWGRHIGSIPMLNPYDKED